ncbi:MAG: DUF58 domain-containing protein [Psychroflexus sp.]|nr:DUF58 domain-containing protein [Psychroflexus sp.]MDR9449037.1 DUF58 domain-containing protein [Psychroflexus sp.]
MDNLHLNLTSKLPFLANQIVEGYISGLHKSPFHGFSSEFAEHRLYNNGESTKHIDWKVYARTNRLYTKKFEEETNLRCQFILDNSQSMSFPEIDSFSLNKLNKISFSCLAIASLCKLLQKQREAVGLSIYNNSLELNTTQKGNNKQYSYIYRTLENVLQNQSESNNKKTDSSNLHKILATLKKRSVVILFSDMLENNPEDTELFDVLKHLKFNKHQVILFHVFDQKKEYNFEYTNEPLKFVDLESNQEINLFGDAYKKEYQDKIKSYFNELKSTCAKYRINYFPADINQGFDQLINNFMIQKQYYSF